MVVYSEPGNNLDLISLSGVHGQPVGSGRKVDSATFTLSGNTTILPLNLKRISALIVNNDDSAKVNVYLGGLSAIPIVITAHGSLQIDKDLPWVGEIDASPVSGTPIVTVNEISVT